MSDISKILLEPKRSMNNLTLIGASLALLLWGAGSPAPAMAQGFPVKLVRIVVPIAAGGNQDIVARGVAQKLTEQLGQQVVVENRPSASGILGTNFVAKAPPDGYTYLSISNTFAATPAVVRNVAYDPVKDFVGVSVVARVPLLLVVIPSFPASSVKELIALAKRRPNELTYGSAGNGSNPHFATELFSHLAGIRMTHIPYKGNAPALIDVAGGQIMLLFDPLSTSMQYVKAGRLKALGVTSLRRSPIFPELPMISESGLPGYEHVVFNAILAPAGTPREILGRMHGEIVKALQQPDIRGRFLEQGVELSASSSPEECSAFVKAETEKYAKIALVAGIRPE